LFRTTQRLALLAALLLWASSARASEELASKATDFEKRGLWAEACRVLDEMGRKDRSNSIIRDAYHRCLRRLHLAIRHADGEYRAALSRLSTSQALDIYSQVLGVLASAHPDREKTTMTALFQHGLAELRNALDEPAFRRNHFPDVKDSALNAFKARLAAWPLTRVATRAEAKEQAMAIARAAAREGVPLRGGAAAALILEFAAGACNALDEHSLFVTPGQLGLLQAALRGKLVSVGLELGIQDGKLVVSQLAPTGSAVEKGLMRGDLVLKIAGASVEELLAEAAAEKLRGDADTTVKVTLVRAGTTFEVELTRRAAPLPSVEVEFNSIPDDMAYYVHLRINYFSEKTLDLVKEALAKASLNGETLKGVILDLRGNPGGLFDSAVSVAELFLPEGVIVIGSSPFKKYNRTFKVESAGPYQMPLVVLIDADSASAAEILAGAIKETRGPLKMALLVGQTTYGKGSIQCFIPLDKTALDRAALKLTVAKLFSPGSLPYTGQGVSPDVPLAFTDPTAVLLEGRKQLLALIKQRAGMMP